MDRNYETKKRFKGMLRKILKAENIKSEYGRTPGSEPMLTKHNYGTDCTGAVSYFVSSTDKIVDRLNEWKHVNATAREGNGDIKGKYFIVVRYMPRTTCYSAGSKSVYDL